MSAPALRPRRQLTRDGPACRAEEQALSPQQQLCLLRQGSSAGKERLRFLVRWCLPRTGRWRPKRGVLRAQPTRVAGASAQGAGFSPGPQGGPAGLDPLRISGPRSHREQTAAQTLRHRTKGRGGGGGGRRRRQLRKSVGGGGAGGGLRAAEGPGSHQKRAPRGTQKDRCARTCSLPGGMVHPAPSGGCGRPWKRESLQMAS